VIGDSKNLSYRTNGTYDDNIVPMFNSSNCDYPETVVLETSAKPSLGCLMDDSKPRT